MKKEKNKCTARFSISNPRNTFDDALMFSKNRQTRSFLRCISELNWIGELHSWYFVSVTVCGSEGHLIQSKNLYAVNSLRDGAATERRGIYCIAVE